MADALHCLGSSQDVKPRPRAAFTPIGLWGMMFNPLPETWRPLPGKKDALRALVIQNSRGERMVLNYGPKGYNVAGAVE